MVSALLQDEAARLEVRELLLPLVRARILAPSILHSYDLTTHKTQLLAQWFIDSVVSNLEFFNKIDEHRTLAYLGMFNLPRLMGRELGRSVLADLLIGS